MNMRMVIHNVNIFRTFDMAVVHAVSCSSHVVSVGLHGEVTFRIPF